MESSGSDTNFYHNHIKPITITPKPKKGKKNISPTYDFHFVDFLSKTLTKFDILFLLKTSWSTRYAAEIMEVKSCSFRDVAKGKGVGGSGIPMTPTFASLLLENKCNRWWNWHDNLVNILNLTQCDPPFGKSWPRPWCFNRIGNTRFNKLSG